MKRFSSMTTTQIARICGVSQGTVDRALHDRPGIAPQTKARILEVAREFDYIPSVGGKTPAGKSMLIGVVLYDLYNPFFSKLAMSLVNEFQSVGYSVIFQFSDKSLDRERSALDYFNYIGVDGIVLFSVGSDNAEYLSYLHSLMRPTVAIGNRMEGIAYIGIDDKRAMYDLTEQLSRQYPVGELVYFSPSLKKELHSLNAQRLRFEGFRQAAKACGRPWRLATDESELSLDCGGIICSTDHYAARARKHLGLSHTLPVAGFDRASFSTEECFMTVEYSTDRIAKECQNYILKRNFDPLIPHTVLAASVLDAPRKSV